MEHVHFIGIGGTGLSAIARILLERGVFVSGSDRQASTTTAALQDAGAHVFIGHKAENVAGADIVVRSSAVPDTNVEVVEALERGIPVVKRDDFVGRMLQGTNVIAIAGTHGKTTTTAMISWTLSALGLDPSFIIGGVSANLGTNARSGKGSAFVVEADEYDRMFLGLSPQIAVVTNVEHDHPDCYPTPDDFYLAFRDFVQLLRPGGTLLACIDDAGTRRLLVEARQMGKQVRSYGLNHWLEHDGPDYAGRGLRPNERGGYSFEAVRMTGDRSPGFVQVDLQVPGRHNVSNSLAVLGVIDLLGLPLDAAASALGQFRGVGRRFDVRGVVNGITVVDDYAHHPSEIRATLAAAKSRYHHSAVWAVWQPHTYSRTRTLLDQFATAFSDAEHVVVTEVYAARENPPADGFSSRRIVEAIQHTDVRLASGLEQVVEVLMENLVPGDVVLVMSAGDADQVSSQLLERLSQADGAGRDSFGSRSSRDV